MPGETYEPPLPGLWHASVAKLKGPPVRFTKGNAEALIPQFRETARYRGWELRAAAVMPDHIHLVVAAASECDPGDMLGDFKSYGSRALNRANPRPPSGTWWTARGSKRVLRNERALHAAIHYVLHKQKTALLTWPHPSEPPA
ncbi:transposase [Pseudobythopirellula maris]|uniref:transposase n=1 Tax=Pseudobythopirellula maris TaxID=2527991 RepID=UPI0018D40597|nr:transposase [Pseudobythopirellula maris]